MKAELPVYLANYAKTRKNEQLPTKNWLATTVASAFTAASRIVSTFISILGSSLIAQFTLILVLTMFA